MKIVFIAFNMGYAGRHVNGPGMCLYNLVSFLKSFGMQVDVFTSLKSRGRFKAASSLSNKEELRRAIAEADLVHHWSGINNESKDAVLFANKLNKPVIIGPNLIDTVEAAKESEYLKDISFKKLLLPNQRLRFLVSKKHEVNIDKTCEFLVGPDIDLWKPCDEKNGRILWKGNPAHFVKGVGFAREVEKKLPEYKIDFMTEYEYFEHISTASKYSLYFSTSLSETMGLALAEQWAAGIPSVTHPKIYLHGKNYITGIITNRSVDSYVEAIKEIMNNDAMMTSFEAGARHFAEDNFSSDVVVTNYKNIVREVL